MQLSNRILYPKSEGWVLMFKAHKLPFQRKPKCLGETGNGSIQGLREELTVALLTEGRTGEEKSEMGT